jgi:hypothetical protein
MKPRLLTILICGLLLAPAQPSWARKWTDNTGKFSVEAEFVEVKDDKVVLLLLVNHILHLLECC